MDSLTPDDLRTLLETQGEWCVSIYMPTVRAGSETLQNPIRFKNLLRNAEERLIKMGLRRSDAADYLAPAAEVLSDTDFWRHQSDGLALFLGPDQLRTFRLPMPFDELIVVTQRFHLKRLLPLLNERPVFYVLALSQNEIRLLEGTDHTIQEVDLGEMPENLSEALQYDDTEKMTRFMPGGAQSGDSGGVFYGRGGDEDENVKTRLLRYFQIVDGGIADFLEGRESPLVLAGVEYLLPIYREASRYRHLVDDGLTGNPEGVHVKDLHERAWELVKPIFDAQRREQEIRYRDLAGRGAVQASNDLEAVLIAAHQGRIATLFVPSGVRQWGTFDPFSYEMEIAEDGRADVQDLLDLAAVRTYLNGGKVYTMPPDQMPFNDPIAAVFRY